MGIQVMSKKLWNTIDHTILKALPNAARGYEQRITIPEFTFLGAKEQPDFGVIVIWFYGNEKTIELKSLKQLLVDSRLQVCYEYP